MAASRYDLVEQLQNLLLHKATGGYPEESEYDELRAAVFRDESLANRMPSFVRNCRYMSQFWQYIKTKFPTYQERREYIWGQFARLLEELEATDFTPSDEPISIALAKFNQESVHKQWEKALSRRRTDPEGAITIARTLLESVCKHILEETRVEYAANADLPKLYGLVAQQLGLAPDQHSEQAFRQILGGCFSVVNGLAAIRNRLSDSHGQGKARVKPAPRHAELAVNLSGSTATFLVQTWEARAIPS